MKCHLTKISTCVCITLICMALTNCRTAKVTYVDPESNEGITTVGSIDIHDWGAAAEKNINSLLGSGVLGSGDGDKKVIMISHVRNNTTEHIDTDLLVKKIRIALNRSGKVLTTTAVSVGGPEDQASMAVRELRETAEFDQSTVQQEGTLIAPDFSLSGKIIQLNTKAGKYKQSAFAFQLSLTNLKNGLAVWEDEVQIVKKGKKAGVGW